MRSTSVQQQAVLADTKIIRVWIADVGLETPFYISTLPFDWTWNGHTYSGWGQILGIEDVPEQTGMAVGEYRITLNGLNASLAAIALSERVAGWPIIIREVHFTQSTAGYALVGTPVIVDIGVLNQMKVTETGTNATIEMSVLTEFSDWSQSRERRYTDSDQQAEFTGDLGLQYVAEMADRVFAWPSREAQM